MNPKKIGIAIGCITVIIAASIWTWRTHFAAPKFNVPLHVGLGQAMGEQTALAVTNNGKLVIVTLAPNAFPELAVQLREFKKVISRHRGMTIKEIYELDTDGKPKFGFGSGLSGRRYVRIVNKNMSAAAIVSFVGAPELSDKELGEMKKTPILIAECRSAEKLKQLFDSKAIHTAVVGRFEYPTPIKGTPRNPIEWVLQRFQIVTAESASSLPSSSSDVEPPVKK